MIDLKLFTREMKLKENALLYYNHFRMTYYILNPLL